MDPEQGKGDTSSIAIQRITSSIQQLNQYVQQLTQNVEKIGGTEDNERNRVITAELIQQSNELSHITNRMLKDLNAAQQGNVENRFLKVQCERLMNDFMSVLNRLQAAKRKAAIREKTQIKTVTVEDEQLNAQRRSGFDDPIQMQQLKQKHQMNLNEIKERQQALTTLEQDIGDINQIFSDLAHMVHDQGEMVDSIEANIEQASVQVHQGYTNVIQAQHYQTKARQKKLLLSAICIAILLILILVFVLWIRT